MIHGEILSTGNLIAPRGHGILSLSSTTSKIAPSRFGGSFFRENNLSKVSSSSEQSQSSPHKWDLSPWTFRYSQQQRGSGSSSRLVIGMVLEHWLNMPILLDELERSLFQLSVITFNLMLIRRNFGPKSSCFYWKDFVFDFAKNSCFYCWLWWCQVTLFCPRARSSSCCPIQCLKSLVSNSTPPEANARPLLTTFILWPGKERRAASFWGRRLRPLWRVARLDHYQRLNLAQRMMVVI